MKIKDSVEKYSKETLLKFPPTYVKSDLALWEKVLDAVTNKGMDAVAIATPLISFRKVKDGEVTLESLSDSIDRGILIVRERPLMTAVIDSCKVNLRLTSSGIRIEADNEKLQDSLEILNGSSHCHSMSEVRRLFDSFNSGRRISLSHSLRKVSDSIDTATLKNLVETYLKDVKKQTGFTLTEDATTNSVTVSDPQGDVAVITVDSNDQFKIDIKNPNSTLLNNGINDLSTKGTAVFLDKDGNLLEALLPYYDKLKSFASSLVKSVNKTGVLQDINKALTTVLGPYSVIAAEILKAGKQAVAVKDSNSRYSMYELQAKPPKWISDYILWDEVVEKLSNGGVDEIPITKALAIYKKKLTKKEAVEELADSDLIDFSFEPTEVETYQSVLAFVEANKDDESVVASSNMIIVPRSSDIYSDVLNLVNASSLKFYESPSFLIISPQSAVQDSDNSDYDKILYLADIIFSNGTPLKELKDLDKNSENLGKEVIEILNKHKVSTSSAIYKLAQKLSKEIISDASDSAVESIEKVTNDLYKVLKDGKPTYEIEKKGSKWLCSCPGCTYRGKCKHLGMLDTLLNANAPKRHPRKELDDLVPHIEELFKAYGSQYSDSNKSGKWAIVGSYRRGVKDFKDIDILVETTKDDFISIEEILKTDPEYKKTMAGKDILRGTYHGYDFDITRVEPGEWPFYLLYRTGSASFNIKMRGKLKAKGWRLNEHGLYNEKGESIPCESEEDIFKNIGIDYVEPKNRN